MVHDLSPFILRFSENFGLRWYGFSYVLGFAAAWTLMRFLVNRQRAGMTSNMVDDLVTYIAFGTLIGGRVGYALFYSPDLFLRFRGDFPFWGVFAVNEGGMASHGGMIGIVVAAWLFARKHGLNPLYLFDLCAVSGPIGVIFGRIANFINGELVGRPAPENLPWAVKFPQDIFLWPSQEVDRLRTLSEVVDKVGVAKDQWFEWMDKYRFEGGVREQVNGVLTKIVDEIQNGNLAAKEAIAPLLTSRHPSQLYAAASEGLLLFIVLFILWRQPRRPGFIAAAFIIGYSLVRIGDEYFRMPDAHIGFQLLGLTRGQWLSIGMFFVGLLMMFVWSKSSSTIVNGWGRLHSVKLGRK